MESRLIVEANANAAGERHFPDEARIDTKLARRPGLALKERDIFGRAAAAPRVLIPRHPREIAIDAFLACGPIDVRNRRQAGVPRSLRVIRAKSPRELRQRGVGHHRQVCAGVAGVGLRAAASLEYADRAAGLR